MATRYRCSFLKACHILYAIQILGWTRTQASIILKVNLGTVSRIARGLRFPGAHPVAPPDDQ